MDELLSEYGFEDVPIVRVSALNALEGDDDTRDGEWAKRNLGLMDAVDEHIPVTRPPA